MSSHSLTIAGYLLCVMAAFVLQLLSYRDDFPVQPFGVVISRIMHTRTGRVGMAIGWAWLGLHFFAR